MGFGPHAAPRGPPRAGTPRPFTTAPLGTPGVVFLDTGGYRPDPAHAVHAFCHALPGRWHRMSVMLSAASAVQWAALSMGFADVPQLLAQAQQLHDDQRRQAPLFLPYLSGERSPHDDPYA